jgi:hypothetical protein
MVTGVFSATAFGVMLKVPIVSPAGMVISAGPLATAPDHDKDTLTPPGGAGAFSFTVLPPASTPLRKTGTHTDETPTAARSSIAAVITVVPNDAVISTVFGSLTAVTLA